MAETLSQQDSEVFLEYALRMTRGRLRLMGLLSSGLVMIAVGLAMLLGIVVADHLAPDGLPGGVRRALLAALILAEAAMLGVTILYPLVRRLNNLYVARLIERAHPDFRNDLTASLELSRQRGVHSGTLAAIKRRAASEVAATDFEGSVNTRHVRLAGIICAVVVAVFGLYSAFSGKSVWPSIYRAFGSEAPAPRETAIVNVTPESGAVFVQGRPVAFSAEVLRGGGACELRVARDGSEFLPEDTFEMRRVGETEDGAVRYEYAWPAAAVHQGVAFEIRSGDAVHRGTINVLPTPVVALERVQLLWPAYVDREDSYRNGNVQALSGSTVVVSARANLPVDTAMLEWAGGGVIRMAVPRPNGRPGERMRGSFVLREPMRYRVTFESTHDEAGGASTDWYEIDLLEDGPPTVTLEAPAGGEYLERAADTDLRVVARVTDDFGIGRAELICSTERRGSEPRRFDLKHFAVEERARGTFRVGELGAPGEQLTCWVVAQDKWADGPHRTASKRFNLRILPPSPAIAGGDAEAGDSFGESRSDLAPPEGVEIAATDAPELTAREILEMAARDEAELEAMRDELGVPVDPLELADGNDAAPAAGEAPAPLPGEAPDEAGAPGERPGAEAPAEGAAPGDDSGGELPADEGEAGRELTREELQRLLNEQQEVAREAEDLAADMARDAPEAAGAQREAVRNANEAVGEMARGKVDEAAAAAGEAARQMDRAMDAAREGEPGEQAEGADGAEGAEGEPGEQAEGGPGEQAEGGPGEQAEGGPGEPAEGAAGEPAEGADGAEGAEGEPGEEAEGAPGEPAQGAGGEPGEQAEGADGAGAGEGEPGEPAEGAPGEPAEGAAAEPAAGGPQGMSPALRDKAAELRQRQQDIADALGGAPTPGEGAPMPGGEGAAPGAPTAGEGAPMPGGEGAAPGAPTAGEGAPMPGGEGAAPGAPTAGEGAPMPGGEGAAPGAPTPGAGAPMLGGEAPADAMSAGEQGAQGLHSSAGGGDPDSGSADARGEVDEFGGVDLPPGPRENLQSVGRIIDEADRADRAGEISDELLERLGMTRGQYAAFVDRYASRFGRLREMPRETTRPGAAVRGGTATVGEEGLQEGEGLADDIGLEGTDEREGDDLEGLYESRPVEVSPEFREALEAYRRAMAEDEDDS